VSFSRRLVHRRDHLLVRHRQTQQTRPDSAQHLGEPEVSSAVPADVRQRPPKMEAWSTGMSGAFRSNADYLPLRLRWRCGSGRCRSATLGAPVVGSGLSIQIGITLSIAPIRSGCDMDEATGLDRFESVPDTACHDVRVAGPK
jgi:hypothetical protein